MAIRIIADSASDISQAEAKAFGITVLPLTTIFGETEYQDGITLSSEEFYEKLVENEELPRTSQVTPHQFAEAFAMADPNDEIIAITISSKLSGTYESAMLAAREFPNVRVFDTLNATGGERIQVMYAIQMVNEGKSVDEILANLEAKRDKVKLIALLDTLEYLKKGGRISSAAAFAGTLLSIKPVVSIENGEVVQVGKARGSKNGNNLLSQLIAKSSGIDFDLPIVANYSGFTDKLCRMYLTDNAHLYRNNDTSGVPIVIMGSTIGTHVGPGTIAISFFTL